MARRSAALRAFRVSRNLTAGALSALGSFALASSPGCGTDAHGVQDCREIEIARCQAAVPCGIVTDETRCEIFYRDHCLHGLPGTSSPQPAVIDQCVNAIKALGQCAKQGGKQAELAACSEVHTHDAELTCDVIQFPEKAYACSFLVSTPPPPEGTGGEAGTAGNGG